VPDTGVSCWCGRLDGAYSCKHDLWVPPLYRPVLSLACLTGVVDLGVYIYISGRAVQSLELSSLFGVYLDSCLYSIRIYKFVFFLEVGTSLHDVTDV